MLQVLVNVSLEKFQLQKKRGMGYAKVVQVKNDDEKNGQLAEILKTMGTRMPARKKERDE